MHRFCRISATPQTLRAQLFPSEEILEQSDAVGLYDGKDKDEAHGDGRLLLSTHRLFYLDSTDPHRQSCFLDLSWIRQTEHWVGFFKSSPKITLLLGEPPSSSSHSPSPVEPPAVQEADPTLSFLHPGAATWTCHICGFSNPPRPECGLCGVKRDVAGAAAEFRRNRDNVNGRAVGASSFGVESLSLGTEPTGAERGVGAPTKEISCPTCTFLNHPSMFRCEMCDSPLGTSSSPSIIRPTPTSRRPASAPLTAKPSEALSTSSTPTHSRATTPAPPSSFPPNAYVRLSFRRGGDKTFYPSLKKALFAKAWEVGTPRPGITPASGAAGDRQVSEGDGMKVIGIDGIMRTMDWKEQTQQGELEEGLRDLEALMGKAKEMVQMAQTLNAKLTAQHEQQHQTDATDTSTSATVIRSSLLSLGLPLPGPAVTPDMDKSDEIYHRELARELGPLLTGRSADRRPLMRDGPPIRGEEDHRGLIGLDEVWCIWNRARGVSLVSPADFLAACPYLAQFTSPPISLHRFTSGLLALATPYYATDEFARRLLKLLAADAYRGRGIGVIEVAREEAIAIGLAEEMCRAVEMADGGGAIVRDEQVAGISKGGAGSTRWWRNDILDFEWQDSNIGRAATSL